MTVVGTEQTKGFPICIRDRHGRVAEPSAPVRVGSPRRAFEDQASAESPRDIGIGAKVFSEDGFAFRSLQQVECSEVRNLQRFVENEGGVNTAIGEESPPPSCGSLVRYLAMRVSLLDVRWRPDTMSQCSRV